MAVRYSGRVRVVVQWVDRTSDYRAVVSAPSVGGVRPEVMRIGHPPASRLAVDSPVAYDEAARAAISFAREEFHELAQVNRVGTGWHLTRSVPRAKSNPSRRVRRRNPSKMRFSDLDIGNAFEFDRSGVPFSTSLASGPWLKVGRRSYIHRSDKADVHPPVHTVGSSKVSVVRR